MCVWNKYWLIYKMSAKEIPETEHVLIGSILEGMDWYLICIGDELEESNPRSSGPYKE